MTRPRWYFNAHYNVIYIFWSRKLHITKFIQFCMGWFCIPVLSWRLGCFMCPTKLKYLIIWTSIIFVVLPFDTIITIMKFGWNSTKFTWSTTRFYRNAPSSRQKYGFLAIYQLPDHLKHWFWYQNVQKFWWSIFKNNLR